ncbi:MAG: aconitase X catalytic domain-containing protein [Oscillospiraceae bacterium]|jgi:predicted aconitase|nr:aconitase X catalytic domain-containing protein [Oscillospiraceae bacterium]
MLDVNLKDDEKRMLQGEDGAVAQKCMEWLVEMCQIAGTDRLVDLDGTGDFHSPWTTMTVHHEITFDELKALTEAGGTFKIPTFANKSPFLEESPIHGFEHCNMCARADAECRRYDDAAAHADFMHDEWYALYRKMGMLQSHSCANYLVSTYPPTLGQHCSWNESSAIPYCNAVLGARTNIDGSFATCYLGKAPYYDMHVTENRRATVLVKTERLIRTNIEWDILGFAVGEDCGLAVPCITGTAKPNTLQFCKLNAAMNTGGAIRMYHIPGSTPEARTVGEAFGGAEPERVTVIGERELRATYEKLNYNPTENVDMVYLGCPHLSAVDLMLLARKLDGKKTKIPLWIMTAPWLYAVARDQGYLKTFEDAGAHLFDGTCLAAMGGLPDGVRTLAVDSAKQAYYITGCFPDDPVSVCYGTQDDCINAAITGKWSGRWA